MILLSRSVQVFQEDFPTTEKRWEFKLDNIGHVVEVEHNPLTGKRSIRVDGRLLTLPDDRGGRYAFRVDGHACEAGIIGKGLKFEYDLVVDGVSMAPEQPSLEIVQIRNSNQVNNVRGLVSFLLLAVGIGGNWFNWSLAHTKGYYYTELAFIAPVFAFLAVYLILFPKDFLASYSGKFTFRMWAAIAIAFLLGLANSYAFKTGLY